MDAQTMHDRMKSILRVIHGAAIDPAAGRARPDQLVLPYDPSFLPDVDLPGLDFDLSKFDLQPERPASQRSSLLLSKSPETSQLSFPMTAQPQLDIPSSDHFNLGAFGSETDISSVHRRPHLSRALGFELGIEEGVLLQPDFEFDEDGNLIEFARPPTDGDPIAGQRVVETPLPDEVRFNEAMDLDLDFQPIPVEEEMDVVAMDVDEDGKQSESKAKSKSPGVQAVNEDDNASEHHEIRMPHTRKNIKTMVADTHIGLRNKDLAQWNNEYLQNMAVASKQKQQNKLPTLAKHNAAFWVFDQGIGSVGIGLGANCEPHPLKQFSGDELYNSLVHGPKPKGRKRGAPHDSDTETEGRRVRAKAGEEVERGLDEVIIQDDPEIGRHAPSSIHDDHSSQMPWNITASIQSSRHGSSAAPAFRGLGSIGGELSSGSRPQDAMALAGLIRSRNRLTSASPLAGRGFPFDMENLHIAGNEGDLELGDFDLDLYLQSELDPERHTVSASAEGSAAVSLRRAGGLRKLDARERKILTSNLDQESLNFLEFLNPKTGALPADAASKDGETQEVTGDIPHGDATLSSEIAFSTLLPPEKTSRVVATNALMHVLTLATKGLLTVRQEPYIDESTKEYGTQYRYGEIFMHL
ncbi:Rad21 Rec8 [Aspergillus sclerotialis]|uniref:Rad21 Rec8 n=1 Tax=Aspergillus sclerotialis TaxID=2070753 RepID=A0A3A2ZT72_9EURO|nr:Rad21 Rec8 [Aspergillus sclerotialis]